MNRIRKSCLAAIITGSLLCQVTQAQQRNERPQDNPERIRQQQQERQLQQQQRQQRQSELGQKQKGQETADGKTVFKARELVGMKVENEQGEKLGEIEGVALDSQGQKVSYLALAPAKGEGEKKSSEARKPGQRPSQQQGVRPGQQPGQQPGQRGVQPGQQPGQRGVQPGQQPGQRGVQPGQQPGQRGVQPGQQGEPPKIEQQSSGKANQPDKLIAVPHEAVTYDQDKEVLILAASKQEIQQAEGFSPDDWPKQPKRAWGAKAETQQQARFEQEDRTRVQERQQADRLRQSREQKDQPEQRARLEQQQSRDRTGRTESRTEQEGDVRLQLNEEQLRVEKETVPAGGVVIRKKVNTRDVTRPVELERETVEIKRLEPQETSQISDEAFQEREIFIRLTEEKPMVTKQARVREIVEVDKQTETEQGQVRAQVREEEVDIQRQQGRQQGGQQARQQGQREQRQPAGGQQGQQQQGQLEQQVKQKLTQPQQGQEPVLNEREMQRIQIQVQNKEVTVSGTVSSEDKKKKIVEQIRQVRGVENVKDELKVGQQR